MRVLMLCDGGESLGVGHVMRSLALAEEAVAAGHDVLVAGQLEGSLVRGQLAAAPVEVVMLGVPVAGGDPQQVIDLVRGLRPDVLHVDSYGAPDRLRDLVASAGLEAGVGKPVFSNMEDGTFGRRPADLVIDPTFGAELAERPEDGPTWLLRGSRYLPLRRRVIDARRPTAGLATEEETAGFASEEETAGLASEEETAGLASEEEDPAGKVARRVLVVMGGTDPAGLAPVAVDLLARTGLVLEVTAIAVGEKARQARAAAQGSALSLTVVDPVDDLAGLMARHDLVISAAGTSVWELCCIGVPAAAVCAVDNQRTGYDRVVAAGAAVGLGGPDLGADDGARERAVDLLKRALTDSGTRKNLVLAGRRVVDGWGAWRVVQTWQTAHRQSLRPVPPRDSGDAALVARRATVLDAGLLRLWRNDPVTRSGSRSSAEVSWDDHLRWLTASLSRTDRWLFVVEDQAGPVGTVRWDLAAGAELQPGADEWEVSITVAPLRRGQSLGRRLLQAGERALLAAVAVTPACGSRLTAYLAVVHRDNLASVRLFESSGYVPDLPPDPQGFLRFRKTARVP